MGLLIVTVGGNESADDTLTIYPGTVFLCDLWRMGGTEGAVMGRNKGK
jgi:hypothetical protein